MPLTPKQEAKVRALAQAALGHRMQTLAVIGMQVTQRRYLDEARSKLIRNESHYQFELRQNRARINGESEDAYLRRVEKRDAETEKRYGVSELKRRIAEAVAEREALFEKSSSLNQISAPLNRFVSNVLAHANVRHYDIGIDYREDPEGLGNREGVNIR